MVRCTLLKWGICSPKLQNYHNMLWLTRTSCVQSLSSLIMLTCIAAPCLWSYPCLKILIKFNFNWGSNRTKQTLYIVRLALEPLEAELVRQRYFERSPHFKGFTVRCVYEYILYSTILRPTAVLEIDHSHWYETQSAQAVLLCVLFFYIYWNSIHYDPIFKSRTTTINNTIKCLYWNYSI